MRFVVMTHERFMSTGAGEHCSLRTTTGEHDAIAAIIANTSTPYESGKSAGGAFSAEGSARGSMASVLRGRTPSSSRQFWTKATCFCWSHLT